MARPKNRPVSLNYLIRIDHKNTHGWQLRAPGDIALPAGEPRSKLFSDKLFGGKTKSLRAAKKVRDQWALKFQFDLRTTTRSRKFGGAEAVGVSLTCARDPRNIASYAWTAVWSPQHKGQMKRAFSLRRHGFATALQYAVNLRERGTGRLMSEEAILHTALRAVLHLRKHGLLPPA